ncbi:14748_t:CDS:2, partial [Racocetra persica]
NHNAKQEQDCHIQAVFTLVNQVRLSSIYKKLQTNNILQKWHYDSIKSIKDSVAYCKKNHNKCDKHNQKPVDRNDPRSKIKDDLFIENKSGDKIIVENTQDNPRWVENNSSHIYTLYQTIKNIEKKKNKRCWKPATIFFYSDENFNSSYEEVLINEFKDQIKYLELLNLLDSKDYSVQIKGHKNENFCPKVIRFSANTNVRFIYDFCENKELKPISEQKFNNTKLFSSF